MGKMISFFIFMLFAIVASAHVARADDCDPAEEFCEPTSAIQACYDNCYAEGHVNDICLSMCEQLRDQPQELLPISKPKRPKVINFESPFFQFRLTIEK